MENESTKKIEEEIRQHKLYKIQIVEAKIREYENTFIEIKENVVLKFTKNASSNILRIIFFLLTVSLFLIGIVFLFPEQLISFFENNGEYYSLEDKKNLVLILPYMGYVLISLSILLRFISSLLKKNIKKRNTIYKMSKLISEVIDYMDNNVKEDKMKYEYFVDSAAEIEIRKNNITTKQK